MKTSSAKYKDTVHRWYVVDAQQKVLGRLATGIAHYLRGKHKPEYSPHLDIGDYIIVINAEKVRVTGNKLKDKVYYRHSGYPGGIKATVLEQMLKQHPERVLERAVRGMLPRTSLGRSMERKLKVYVGVDHPHRAQNPIALSL